MEARVKLLKCWKLEGTRARAIPLLTPVKGWHMTLSCGRDEVIVGSVRMGYGHHRIAYSALTWALELGGKPFLLETRPRNHKEVLPGDFDFMISFVLIVVVRWVRARALLQTGMCKLMLWQATDH